MIDRVLGILSEIWAAWPTWVPIVVAIFLLYCAILSKLDDCVRRIAVAVLALAISHSRKVKYLENELESLKPKDERNANLSNLESDEETARWYKEHFGRPPPNF